MSEVSTLRSWLESCFHPVSRRGLGQFKSEFRRCVDSNISLASEVKSIPASVLRDRGQHYRSQPTTYLNGVHLPHCNLILLHLGPFVKVPQTASHTRCKSSACGEYTIAPLGSLRLSMVHFMRISLNCLGEF